MGLIPEEKFLENTIATTMSTIYSKNNLLDEDETNNGAQLALAIINLLTFIILCFNSLYFWFSFGEHVIMKVIAVLCFILGVLQLTTSITLFVCNVSIFNQITVVNLILLLCSCIMIFLGLGYMLCKNFCTTCNQIWFE